MHRRHARDGAEQRSGRADFEGALSSSRVHERIRNGVENLHSARTQHGLPHPHGRQRIGQYRSSRHDEPEPRLLRGNPRRTGGARPRGVYVLQQARPAYAQSHQYRRDTVPQYFVYFEKSRAWTIHAVIAYELSRLCADPGQRACARLAPGTGARPVGGGDYTDGARAQDCFGWRGACRERARTSGPGMDARHRGILLAGFRGHPRAPQYRHDAHRDRGVRNQVTRPLESLLAGLAEFIKLVHDEAGRVLNQSADGTFDLVFLDSERSEYVAWWPHVKRILRPGGLLVVDNALSHVEEMAPFVALVKADPDFNTSLVPVGNGEFLAVKEIRGQTYKSPN